MAAEELPSSIGRYEIHRELGRGMMGVVYEARDPTLGRTVALKVIRLLFALSDDERETFERRFLTEARVAAQLSHPGIVVVHDFGRDPKTGALYIALEHLEGENLADKAAAGRLDPREVLRVLAQVAEALHYAHSRGVVHRDIKPANIMVLSSGEIKIMDFGLAKHEAGYDLTATGQFVGTPMFMSPEQVLGQKLDGRSDLFSLGSVAYTLLSGRRPFEADNVPRIMNRIAHQDPTPLATLVPGISEDVEYVVARALAKSRDDRYPGGGTMAEDIEDVLDGRRPRHRGTWAPPLPAEATAVSARPRPDVPEISNLDLERLEPPARKSGARAAVSPPASPSRPSPLRALGLLVMLAGLTYHFFTHIGPERLADALLALSVTWQTGYRPGVTRPGPASMPRLSSATGGAAETSVGSPGAPSPGASAESPGTATTAPAHLPQSGAATGATPITTPVMAAPAPVEPGAPVASEEVPFPPATLPPSAAPGAPASPSAGGPPRRAPETAGLAIRMEHHLKSGTVRVWLDGRLVLEDTLDSRVTKKILFFPMRRGVVEETLRITPGRHKVKVQVRWDRNVETRQISATFKPGGTRHLDVSVKRLGGKLSLEWR